MASPPCVSTAIRIHCADGDRHFGNQTCLVNHMRRIGRKKADCKRTRQCGTCVELIFSGESHECGKHFCNVCLANIEIGHLCYMQPLKNVFPPNDRLLYIFYDFEKKRRIRGTPKLLRCMFRAWSVYSISARGARTFMTVNGIAKGVEYANTSSGMIPFVTYSHSSANRDPGSGR